MPAAGSRTLHPTCSPEEATGLQTEPQKNPSPSKREMDVPYDFPVILTEITSPTPAGEVDQPLTCPQASLRSREFMTV